MQLALSQLPMERDLARLRERQPAQRDASVPLDASNCPVLNGSGGGATSLLLQQMAANERTARHPALVLGIDAVRRLAALLYCAALLTLTLTRLLQSGNAVPGTPADSVELQLLALNWRIRKLRALRAPVTDLLKQRKELEAELKTLRPRGWFG
jgi:hypothetical protein